MTDIASFAEQHFDHLFQVPLVWVTCWMLASVAYRMWRKKPFFAHTAGNAVFVERWVSGNSNKNILTKLGGARNCLSVVLTPSSLEIRPHFPFSLLFLPEIYDLELSIPRTRIRSAVRERRFFKDTLHVRFVAPGETERSVRVVLRRPQEFLDALDR